MTHRPEIREKLQKAVRLIIDTQNGEGGWRYQPVRRDADLSVTICQVNALRAAPEEGWEIGDLMNITGMTRTTLYRYLQDLVRGGRAYQVSRGRWRARTTEDGHGE